MNCAVKDIAREALRGALSTRRKVKVEKDSPINIYDVAGELDVEVKYMEGSSFEGMFVKQSASIVIPAERPVGRQAFACAHELGHWYFGHGTQIDDVATFGNRGVIDRDEDLANTYASYMLMPKWAVERVFQRRGWNIESLTPEQLYMASNQLNVGYQTLCTQLRWNLKLLNQSRYESLIKVQPKQIRSSLLGGMSSTHLVVADLNWESIAIDLSVGDYALLPHESVIEGRFIKPIAKLSSGQLVQATEQGISRVESTGDWASYVRVSRAAYVGRAKFRHFEDYD